MSEENTQEMEEKQDQAAAMDQVATVSDGREDEREDLNSLKKFAYHLYHDCQHDDNARQGDHHGFLVSARLAQNLIEQSNGNAYSRNLK